MMRRSQGPLALTLMAPLLLAPACKRGDFELELLRSEQIPTVFTASWDVDLDGIDGARVEFGRRDQVEYSVEADMSGGGPYQAVLIGMKPVHEYKVRVVIDAQGEQYVSDEQLVTTGLYPSEFPELALEMGRARDSWQGLLCTSVVAVPAAAVILDEDGDYVWWYQPEDIKLLGRSALSRDGRSMLFMDINLMGDQPNALHRVSLDGSEHETTSLPDAHHDFLELPDGSIAFLSYKPRDVRGEQLAGDSVQELRPDGSIVEVYNIWMDEEARFRANDELQDGMWPHANAIDYLEEEDAYLVSFLSLESIFRIDRSSGGVDWRLGGYLSDFARSDGSTDYFRHQHQMQVLEDSLLVFSNGDGHGGASHPVELAMDEDALWAEERWEYWSDPAHTDLILGDVHRFDDGNTLVTYSYSGQIQEVTPEGEPIWQLSAGMGGALGYTTWMEGPPAQ